MAASSGPVHAGVPANCAWFRPRGSACRSAQRSGTPSCVVARRGSDCPSSWTAMCSALRAPAPAQPPTAAAQVHFHCAHACCRARVGVTAAAPSRWPGACGGAMRGQLHGTLCLPPSWRLRCSPWSPQRARKPPRSRPTTTPSRQCSSPDGTWSAGSARMSPHPRSSTRSRTSNASRRGTRSTGGISAEPGTPSRGASLSGSLPDAGRWSLSGVMILWSGHAPSPRTVP